MKLDEDGFYVEAFDHYSGVQLLNTKSNLKGYIVQGNDVRASQENSWCHVVPRVELYREVRKDLENAEIEYMSISLAKVQAFLVQGIETFNVVYYLDGAACKSAD